MCLVTTIFDGTTNNNTHFHIQVILNVICLLVVTIVEKKVGNKNLNIMDILNNI